MVIYEKNEKNSQMIYNIGNEKYHSGDVVMSWVLES